MSINFMMACPHCLHYVEPLQINDIMKCPLCGKFSRLILKTVTDEPEIEKI